MDVGDLVALLGFLTPNSLGVVWSAWRSLWQEWSLHWPLSSGIRNSLCHRIWHGGVDKVAGTACTHSPCFTAVLHIGSVFVLKEGVTRRLVSIPEPKWVIKFLMILFLAKQPSLKDGKHKHTVVHIKIGTRQIRHDNKLILQIDRQNGVSYWIWWRQIHSTRPTEVIVIPMQ